ncbi:Subtilisin-like protease 8 [Malassezia restricta CBS 7877]|uniref:Subtilisin-like protease 8 n=1 Tax=Malassezia restricta (strain ATCC 96810 / NBRC 103918 / CBS 7877) TaxID=425264 RepID=A0A3G2S9U7_MALR7|nr:Subtilisin-like protease 8 [Malassezia restricta CBS 7877]
MAPLVQTPGTKAVPDKYMVVLKEGVSADRLMAHSANVASFFRGSGDADPISHVYDMGDAMRGYAGHFSPEDIALIRSHPDVAFVERDSIVDVTMLAQDDRNVRNMSGSAVQYTFPWDNPYRHLTEQGAPWGLARISHQRSLSLGTFNKYVYESIGGEGVTAYVIDTGVNIEHSDFGGRAKWGTTIPANDTDTDGHGHGTHVAGTIASNTFGVAKKAEIIAVKVLGSHGQGSMSDVTAGVLWAVRDAENKTRMMRGSRKLRGFVSNMSLGGTKSPTLDRAVGGAVAAGMHFGVAAGNEDQDACNVSPADVRAAVTVGASTIADERAFFSNTGPCVDIFAPGLNILSLWNAGPQSINTISGTSMAAPHVVGLMAYLLSIYGSSDFRVMEEAKPHGASCGSEACHAAHGDVACPGELGYGHREQAGL